MTPWRAAAATFFTPFLLLVLGALLFATGNLLAPSLLLVALAPAGLSAGYLLARLPGRGLRAALGGLAILLVGLLLVLKSPRDFEDAGVLVLLLFLATLGVFTLYAALCARSVYKAAAARPT